MWFNKAYLLSIFTDKVAPVEVVTVKTPVVSSHSKALTTPSATPPLPSLSANEKEIVPPDLLVSVTVLLASPVIEPDIILELKASSQLEILI